MSALSNAVSKALSEGFQVEVEAFQLLATIPPEVDMESLIRTVILNKAGKEDMMITKSDIEKAVPREVQSSDVSQFEVAGQPGHVEVVSDPTSQIAPAEADVGFKKLFLDRYWRLLGVARQRPDSRNIVSVESVKESRANKARIAGLLSARNSRHDSVELVLEDTTGSARVQCNDDLAASAMKFPLDSLVVAEVSSGKGGQLYASAVTLPDVPSKKPSTSSHRAYAVLLSDLHIGSKMFLQEDFERFVSWLNGKLGDLDIVRRVKYVIIAGDIVDGIGVYPGQEFQLMESNLKKQYWMAAQMLAGVPKHIKVVAGPGNHDPVRQALPQPSLPSDIAEPFCKLENVMTVGNPSYIKLDGVNFLVYHGRSLDDIIATIPDLSYSRPAAAMQILLRSRHLAPMYGKRTALAPELRDMLVIDPVPDVFHAGHVHAIDVLDYRGTLVVNSGTFQAQTPFQANMGLEPTCSIVPIVDLSTLELVKRSFAKQVFGQAS